MQLSAPAGSEFASGADELRRSRSNLRPYAIGAPSDPAVYAWIAKQQGRNLLDELPEDAENDPEFTPAELAVRQDFVKQKAQGVNDWYKDWWEFTRNFNPLLTLCYVHPLHPITRKERFVVYCVQVLLSLALASYMALGEVCLDCDIDCGSGDDDPIFNSTGGMLHSCETEKMEQHPKFCCQHYGIGSAQVFLKSTPVIHVFGTSYYIAGALYSAVWNMLFALTSFQLMLCGCVQSMSWKKRQKCQYIGYAVFTLIGVLLTLSYIPLIPYVLDFHKIVSVSLNFFISKLGTTIGMTLWGTIVFHVLWKLQAPAVSLVEDEVEEEETEEEEEEWAGGEFTPHAILLAPNSAAGCCCGWPVPPTRNADGVDDRGALSKLASPLFHVTAQEYLEYIATQDDERKLAMLGEGNDSTWTLSLS